MIRSRGLALGLFALVGCSRMGAQITESPTAVERGMWLVESDIVAFDYRHNRSPGSHLDDGSLSIGAIGLSTGIAPRWDMQVATEIYHRDHSSLNGSDDTVSGFGDTTLRVRWNFAGDESKGAAFGILPWVKLPTAGGGVSNGEADRGAILVFGAPCAAGGALNAMIEVSRIAEIGGSGRETGWFASVAFVKPLAEKWEWYVEAAAEWTGSDESDAAVIAGAGLRRAVTEAFVLDLEIAAGLTREAPDVGPALRCEWEF